MRALPAVSLAVLFVTATLTVSLAGCGAFVAGGTDAGVDDGPRRVPQLPTCDVDGDCKSDERCVDGRCHLTCSASADCKTDRPQCDTDRGVCVRCLADSDCSAGDTCDGASGECVEAVGEGEGEGASEGEGAGGEGEGEGGGGVCAPDAIGCVDDHSAFVCAHDGQSSQTVPCRDDQKCIEGVCHDLVCNPNAVSCSGNALVTCDAAGTSSSASSCDDGCQGDFGCTCDSSVTASCVERACEPGSSRCVGNSAQACSASGASFADLVDCGSDSCVDGRCLPQGCTPGAKLCSGRDLLTCNNTGTAFTEVTCDGACSGPDGTAACTNQVCTPLSQTCADDTHLRICNSSGTASADAPCGVQQECQSGACVDVIGPPPPPPPTGPTMTVSLAWTPTTEDMDLYLSRDINATSLCTTDTCFFGNCKNGDARPDWDDNGAIDAGDPLLDVTDAAHANPEVTELVLPSGAARSFRVGAHNFGGVDGGTAGAAVAVITVKIDGALVHSFTRNVLASAQWKGVTIAWDGAHATASDDASVESNFTCQGSSGGTACTSDGDCTNAQACVLDFLGLEGTCEDVQCRSNSECAGNANGHVCDASHSCVAGPVAGFHQACSSSGEACAVGLTCGILSNVCEESCSIVTCTTPNQAGCCTISGASTCTPDPFIGISGECSN